MKFTNKYSLWAIYGSLWIIVEHLKSILYSKCECLYVCMCLCVRAMVWPFDWVLCSIRKQTNTHTHTHASRDSVIKLTGSLYSSFTIDDQSNIMLLFEHSNWMVGACERPCDVLEAMVCLMLLPFEKRECVQIFISSLVYTQYDHHNHHHNGIYSLHTYSDRMPMYISLGISKSQRKMFYCENHSVYSVMLFDFWLFSHVFVYLTSLFSLCLRYICVGFFDSSKMLQYFGTMPILVYLFQFRWKFTWHRTQAPWNWRWKCHIFEELRNNWMNSSFVLMALIIRLRFRWWDSLWVNP